MWSGCEYMNKSEYKIFVGTDNKIFGFGLIDRPEAAPEGIPAGTRYT